MIEVMKQYNISAHYTDGYICQSDFVRQLRGVIELFPGADVELDVILTVIHKACDETGWNYNQTKHAILEAIS